MSTSSNQTTYPPRVRAYDSDLSDDEWRAVQPLVEIEQTGPGPRRSVNLREVVNALLYKERTGCQWRMLPLDLPPRSTVSGYYQRWKHSGVWDQVRLRLKHRDLLAHAVAAPHHPQITFAAQAVASHA